MRVPFTLKLFKKYNSDVKLLEYRSSDSKIINCFVAEHLVNVPGAFPIITTNNNPEGFPVTHTITGNVLRDNCNNSCDLFINIPEEIIKQWGNVYENGIIDIFDCKKTCDDNVSENINRLGYIKIIINRTTGYYIAEKIL